MTDRIRVPPSVGLVCSRGTDARTCAGVGIPSLTCEVAVLWISSHHAILGCHTLTRRLDRALSREERGLLANRIGNLFRKRLIG